MRGAPSVYHAAKIAVLIEAQDGKCCICDKPLANNFRGNDRLFHPLRPTIEHVWPKWLGSPKGWGNILAAHARCNGDKGQREPSESQVAALERVNAKLAYLVRPALESRARDTGAEA